MGNKEEQERERKEGLRFQMMRLRHHIIARVSNINPSVPRIIIIDQQEVHVPSSLPTRSFVGHVARSSFCRPTQEHQTSGSDHGFRYC